MGVEKTPSNPHRNAATRGNCGTLEERKSQSESVKKIISGDSRWQGLTKDRIRSRNIIANAPPSAPCRGDRRVYYWYETPQEFYRHG